MFRARPRLRVEPEVFVNEIQNFIVQGRSTPKGAPGDPSALPKILILLRARPGVGRSSRRKGTGVDFGRFTNTPPTDPWVRGRNLLGGQPDRRSPREVGRIL